MKYSSSFHCSSIALAVSLALAAVPTSWAGDILRGGTAAPQANTPAATSGTTTAQAAKAQANAADTLARTTAALQSVRAMQTAARKIAWTGPNNLGARLPKVPNGLVIGGLVPSTGLKSPGLSNPTTNWIGANKPIQTTSGGTTKINIVQTQSQALLNWETFNVGKKTEVNFNQSAGKNDAAKWIAFNQISDPGGNPTQILGSIKAEGQVYLINQNGIIFGGNSQVNTRSFTASSLPLNTNMIDRGLLNNPDAQFLFSALALPAGSKGPTPVFTPSTSMPSDGKIGDVVVQKGAQISAPTSAEKVGGRVTLVGANVTNEGTISTPDGQTILAAGLQVGFLAHATSDPSLRGLDVYVGQVVDPNSALSADAGSVTNNGLIEAPRANVTLVGKTVRQLSIIESSTSTAVNGRVDLLANYAAIPNVNYDPLDPSQGPLFLNNSSGSVELGIGSAIRILPEYTNTDKVVGTQLSLPSRVNIEGRAIHFLQQSEILAPSARVDVKAGNWLPMGNSTELKFTGGQIYLEATASINVAGSVDITAPITDNILTLQLRGSELANSPLQRTGTLRGTSLTIDARQTGLYNGINWTGTPLGDASGYVGLIQRTVGALTTTGGNVNLKAGESVILQTGSQINVSGGSVNYEGGMIETTRVLADGNLYDISQATPDQIYSGIYTGTSTFIQAKYGLSETYTNPLALTGAHFEAGYRQGAAAGTISITAPSVALDGDLLGQTAAGNRQSNIKTALLPTAGSLNLTFLADDLVAPFSQFSPTPPKIVFSHTKTLPEANAFSLDENGKPTELLFARKTDVVLSPQLLTTNGFGSLSIDNGDGNILVPENTPLSLAFRGSLTLRAANLDIRSSITSPGGTLDFTVYDFSPTPLSLLARRPPDGLGTPPPDLTLGLLTLGSKATLSTAGLVVDYRSPLLSDLPPIIEGGKITINTYSAHLLTGSEIDVSGGLTISELGKNAFGNAGSITINTGRDPNISSLLGGQLILDSKLKAFSGTKGGALSLRASLVQIGGNLPALVAGETPTYLIQDTVVAKDELLHLSPEFFSSGGFTSFNLTGIGKATANSSEFIPAIRIADNTVIRPQAENWRIKSTNGADSVVLQALLNQEELRTPVSLSFNTSGTKDTFNSITKLRGDFVLGRGASIQTDAGGNFTFAGDTAAILGSIITPGGNISISAASSFPTVETSGQTLPLPTVDLGPRSVLSTVGTVRLSLDPFKRRIGSVLAGGNISVSGNIVAEKGALLDVSGASDFLDLRPSALTNAISFYDSTTGNQLVSASSGLTSPLFNLMTISTRAESNAGTIRLAGSQQLLTNATLRGEAGGSSAQGGSLEISSGRFIDTNNSVISKPTDINLVVQENTFTIPANFYPQGETAIGQFVPITSGDPLLGRGYFALRDFKTGGFDSLKLSGGSDGAVQFSGNISLSALRSLSIAEGGVLFADSAVSLRASYVSLGTAFQTPTLATEITNLSLSSGGVPFYLLPTFGSGSLTVRASLIDIGNLSLQNIGKLKLIADEGDIRGNGVLNLAGSIQLRAGQIYPTTATRFTISAYDHTVNSTVRQGSVVISQAGSRTLPLSAGGQLSIYASNIVQNGTLRAPLGTISLGWDGTGASPVDFLTGAGLVTGNSVPITQQLTLAKGSVTSVSAIDAQTGKGLILPYGINLNGTSWIDPTGIDITAGGLPAKTVNLSALNLADRSGSLIDVRAGGDLYAYRWVTGLSGTRDILASSGSFAILPDYEADYAPYAPNNSSTNALNLASSDPGYVNNTLSVGDKIHLGASEGLPKGNYTLLPARYALLPGGVLITPQSGNAIGTFTQPEGNILVSGYRYNSINTQQNAPAQALRFEVATSAVLRNRAQYDDFFANSFLKTSATNLGISVPRLPIDSGRIAFSGINSLQLQGNILGQAVEGGQGAEIDLSSLSDFLISGKTATAPARTIVLNAVTLSSFGAESLLIGGLRQTTTSGTTLIVNTSHTTVDNAGAPLRGAEIILVAQDRLTLAPGARIIQTGSTGEVSVNESLSIGNAANDGSGNGLLLRVSDTQASIIRSGISSLTAQAALGEPPVLTVGAGAKISATALTLDSTYGTSLSSQARLDGKDIALNSGQILLQFANAGSVPAIAGLTLSGPALQALKNAESLSLLSYSSIDLYGAGNFGTNGAFALHTGKIRSFNNSGGSVTFAAPEIALDNNLGRTGPGSLGLPTGRLIFDSLVIRLSGGDISLDQLASVEFKATDILTTSGTGSLATQGDLSISTPLITAASAVKYSITAGGAITIEKPRQSTDIGQNGGLGATLAFTGTAITVNSNISLGSGKLSLLATAGDLLVGNLGATRLDLGGTTRIFNDLTRYTDGGAISLVSENGSVTLGSDSNINVAANAGGGNAGSLNVSAKNGDFTLTGVLDGSAGKGGNAGSFVLDVASQGDITPVDEILNRASFDYSRNYRIRSGDVTLSGLALSQNYRLSADQGSITIADSGKIGASGQTGGNIDLIAFGNVTLESGAQLTVAAQDFNNAGKGGTISLEAGSQRNGIVGTGSVDIQTGSLINLSVASKISFNPATDATTEGTRAYQGQFSGTLHLRAPQNAAGTDLLVNSINGTIVGASSILVEGYRLFDLTNTNGTITNTGTINATGGLMVQGNNIQGSINANGQNFLGSAGTTTTGYIAIRDRLLGTDPQGLESIFVLAPGAEVIKRNGNITLGATNSTTSSDWNLAKYRYGAKSAPGVLTLRASGNLTFFNALSDGFTPTQTSNSATWLYQAELTEQNALLPINAQSWSYRLSAGADFSASDYEKVLSLKSLAANSGSLQLGKFVTTNNGNPTATGGVNAQTTTAVGQRYQTIRTGSGDIRISTGRDVQLRNQFATIYTAGTKSADPTLGGTFQPPPSVDIGNQGSNLGATQQLPTYAAQYSLAGGNVNISAQNDINHLTLRDGVEVADSEKQIPNNWLYRRGYVDPSSGEFGTTRDGDIASTTWWVDFSNFFEGVGALGGGNVTLTAGNDVSNVDAVAPTNARLTYQTPNGDRLATNQTLLELGGGDVTVIAGRNINAGIYYVERGQGTLSAGNSIITNETRSASIGALATPAEYNPSSAQWLPTTLFLGKGGFDVSANNDLLIGPVVNPFLLPGGVNNSFWRKSYFSTYSPTSGVNLTSLGGSITIRESSTQPGLNDDVPILQNWMQSVHLLRTGSLRTVSSLQPWLRLDESEITSFRTVFTLLPGTLRATALSGDVNVVGTLNLAPSASGTIELVSSGAINGLQITGITTQASSGTTPLNIWSAATINLSDASPSAIPGVYSPYAYQVRAGTTNAARTTALNFLSFIDQLFAETGSSTGAAAVIQTQQALHGENLLHADDNEPIRIYSATGSISGLTLFSSKSAQIVAGNDIDDVAFYIQNTNAKDISVISAGHDIVAYKANSLLRVQSQSAGNLLNFGETPLNGDLQISGPGTLEVFAGRNLDLGTGANNADGTGVGLTSIGNARNPNLPFAGADIIAAAGVGPAFGLANSPLDFDTFITEIIQGPNGLRYLTELAETSTALPANLTPTSFDELEPELRAKLALEIFYLALRDTGRDYNLPGSPGFGNYNAGFAAIDALLGVTTSTGEITTRSRDIRTKSGGNISLLAPGGGLTLTTSVIGTPLAPPGVLTEAEGNISIFTKTNVDIGISRIFTLRGGNEIIWSSNGNIAAGSSSKTVQSAPPTRVLIDPQSAALNLDLAGLATGGGIGVLATIEGVAPGSVDLIAPTGFVDAGDAGIRATGNLNIAAVQVLNADNIQVSGTSIGTPPPVVAPTLNLAVVVPQNTANIANEASEQARKSAQSGPTEDLPSIITVEVLGYGG